MFSPFNKKASAAIGIILCLFSFAFAYSGGTGEPNDPYQIATKADLLVLATDTNNYNKCFVLMADINLEGQVFTKAIIAADTSSSGGFQGTVFTGTFDGNGRKITNFTINGGSNWYLGLFGYISSGGSVRNLGLENFSVSGSQNVGGLAGFNTGNISNCYSTGTVSGSYYSVGGLLGVNDGSVSDCYATGAVNSNGYVSGGLVGWNYHGSISNCYSTGTVDGSERVGGLVGYNYGSISDCCSMGAVSGDRYVGGLVGENDGRISNCYATGTVSGSSGVGGLVGKNVDYISNCYSIGTVSGGGSVGGIVGDNRSSIRNCYSTGTVSGSSSVGGLVGSGYYGSSIRNCYTTGMVTGDGSVGGLVGSNIGCGGGSCSSSISNCYSTGAISGSSNVGGLVGYRSNSTINNSFWDVDTSGQTTSAGGEGKTTAEMYSISTFFPWVCDDAWTIDDGNDYPRLAWQGLPGQLITLASVYDGSGTAEEPFLIYTPQQLNTIGLFSCAMNKHFKLMSNIDLSCFPENQFNIIGNENLFFTGVFDGNGHIISNLTIDAGKSYIGLFGNTLNSVITNLGTEDVNVFGQSYVGGLVGRNNYGSISNCYSTGTVRGSQYVGGLVGENWGSISNCYSTGAVSGSYFVGGLVGSNHRASISDCYATGTVSGSQYVGGLVGTGSYGITASFWDTETSGQTTSEGGTGKTTAEMKTLSTFTSARWDFVGETANGTEDIWTICEGASYPRFTWQNQPPIAEAGPDQTAYAWIDGVAEVDLDGLGSSDADECNGLTYYWSWVIDGNTYEAEGASPTIELPVGVHTIQLVVNDGLADSVPDDVNITVVAPLKGKLEIMPRIINRFSRSHHKPEKILAFVRLPEGIAKKDVSNEPLTLYPGEIEASRQWIIPIPYGYGRHKKWLVGILAFFDKDDVLDAIPENGRVELKVAGELVSGRYFYGSDTVIIIGPKRPWYFPPKK